MFEKVKIWLNPLIVALCGLITAATVYLNEGRDNTAEMVHADFDKRITLVETKTDQIQPLIKQLTDLNIRLSELVVKIEMFHGK